MPLRDWFDCVQELTQWRIKIEKNYPDHQLAGSFVRRGAASRKALRLIEAIESDAATEELQHLVRKQPGAVIQATREIFQDKPARIIQASPSIQQHIVSATFFMLAGAKLTRGIGIILPAVEELSSYGTNVVDALVTSAVEVSNADKSNKDLQDRQDFTYILRPGLLQKASRERVREAAACLLDLTIDWTNFSHAQGNLFDNNWGRHHAGGMPPVAIVPPSEARKEIPEMALLGSNDYLRFVYRTRRGAIQSRLYSSRQLANDIYCFKEPHQSQIDSATDLISSMGRAVALHAEFPETFVCADKEFGYVCRRIKSQSALFDALPEHIRSVAEGGASFGPTTRNFGKLIAVRVKAANL